MRTTLFIAMVVVSVSIHATPERPDNATLFFPGDDWYQVETAWTTENPLVQIVCTSVDGRYCNPGDGRFKWHHDGDTGFVFTAEPAPLPDSDIYPINPAPDVNNNGHVHYVLTETWNWEPNDVYGFNELELSCNDYDQPIAVSCGMTSAGEIVAVQERMYSVFGACTIPDGYSGFVYMHLSCVSYNQ